MIARRTIYSLLVIEILLLVVVASLTYLPNLRKATIYKDDWYYALDRTIGGPQAFHEMFHIDRPARGYFFEIYYRLFGIEPVPYHLGGFVWRLLMGLSALWLFLLLWPRQRAAAVLIVILFVIYPGYTRWMEGFEDQPKAVSLFLQVTSFALTLQAIKTKRLLPRIALWVGSVLTGWGYLALIDYAMGMEVFRFLCVFAFLNRDRNDLSLFKKGVSTLRASYPAVLVLGGFLFWRIFLFNNERPETDIKLQLETMVQSPLDKGAWWILHFFQSMVNSTVLAWTSYPFQDLFKLNLSTVLLGLALALLCVAGVVFGIYWIEKRQSTDQGATSAQQKPFCWATEAIWIGLLGTAAGVIPVIMANRSVEFGILSHYGLPASLSSATLVVGLLYSLSSRRMRLGTVAGLVLLAVLTQYITSDKVAREEEIIANFWHQMAWRAPGIREATGLVVNYPTITIGEDVDSVHGPANYIYYPEPREGLPVRYKLFATKMYPWTVKEYLAGGKSTITYRSHYGVIDYSAILVISQPSVNACVHVVDRQWPWYSYDDPDTIMAIGQGSNVRNVLPNATPPSLSPTIFGPEPKHGWCYSFEKAELALQQKNWDQIIALGDEAARLELEPYDPLEWTPFAQAYAVQGDEQNFIATAAKITQTAYNRTQMCNVMKGMENVGFMFQPPIQDEINQNICGNQTP